MSTSTNLGLDQVRYEVSERIATVSLHRPDKLNAWTRQMSDELRTAMLAAKEDPEVRVIILTGTGRGFCSGADMGLLDDIQAGASKNATPMPAAFDPRSPADFHGPYSYFPTIPKPVLCAVNGVAAGIGFVHPLYCDLRFAGESAYFLSAFTRRGAIAEHGCSWLLPRLVGLSASFDILYSGRRIDAQEALRIRLVDRVVPDAELMTTVRDYARVLASDVSPRSMAVIKSQLWASPSRSLGEDVTVSLAQMSLGFASPDFKEGVRSFVEKRAPQFPDLQPDAL